MGKDVELDRLGIAKDKAYAELKSIRDQKNALGKECSRLHDALDDAYKAQNSAYEKQQSDWEFHKKFMQDCSDKINFFKLESDRYHTEMVNCFQRASDAHNAHDGAGAKNWSNSGHNSKALMRGAKEQISHWVSQSQNAKFRFENSGSKVDFENAKRRTAKFKAEFAEVSTKYKPIKALCEQKQIAFDKAKRLFDDRLNCLKRQNNDKHRKIGSKVLNIVYFEQLAKKRGRELFEANAEKDKDRRIQDMNDVCKVSVKAGWSIKHELPTTDCFIFVKGIKDKHYHIVYDEIGRELISEWRLNH